MKDSYISGFSILVQLSLVIAYTLLLWKNYKFYSNMVKNPDQPISFDVAKSLSVLYLYIFVINIFVITVMFGVAFYFLYKAFY